MIKEVEKLFNMNLSTYELAKQTGVPEQTVRDLRNGNTSLRESKYKNVEELYIFYRVNYGKETWSTVEVDPELIENIEFYDEIVLSNDHTTRTGEHRVVMELVNGIIYEVHTEIDGLSNEDGFYFTDQQEAYRYMNYLAD